MMHIQIDGRDDEGAPRVILRASGGYAPDVMHDLKARAVEMFKELFPEVETLVGDEDTEPEGAA